MECGEGEMPDVSVMKTPEYIPRRSASTEKDAHCYIKMLYVLLAAVFLTTLTFSLPLSQDHHGEAETPLRFNSDGTFQISIFEDLHFGENAWEQWGPQQDVKTAAVMNAVLDAESPQLVVLNGDLITGENTFLENSTTYIDQIVAPLVQRDLPWASTYGNHDSDFNISRRNILGRERLYRNARTSQMVFGEDSGVSNYYLPVYPSDGGSKPCLLLWFFDSRGGFLYQQTDERSQRIGQPNWVDHSVVDWFQKTRDSLNAQFNRTIPSLAFVHIPTNASRALQLEVGVDPYTEPGIDEDTPLAGQAQGWCADGTSNNDCEYGGQDLPFMRALASTSGLLAVFSAHDHGDTWCFKWNETLPGMDFAGNGLNLCFGQHSGYGGYGSWSRGSRQVLLTEASLAENEIDTWIRLESGDVVSSVTLNATYGLDRYPPTLDTHV
ncbi:Metallo-dependent phosphatase [Hortaea werneckii]|nr:Metallo-dependent phosphatase [Hortaea werneckii]